MWQGRDKDHTILEVDAIEKSGVMFQLNGWPPLDSHAYGSIIDDLEKSGVSNAKNPDIFGCEKGSRKNTADGLQKREKQKEKRGQVSHSYILLPHLTVRPPQKVEIRRQQCRAV